jgi:hypothetical protein
MIVAKSNTLSTRLARPWLALGLVALCACWNSDPLIDGAGSSSGGNSSGGQGGSTAANIENGSANVTSNGATGSTSSGGTAGPTAPDGYYTQGNTIFHESGNSHVFRGMARPSLEWNPKGEQLSPGDYQTMASWGSNVVRIALNQGFWLEGSSVYAPQYKSTIDQNIQWAQDAGLDVIVDLHWSDKGNFANKPDQQRMADTNSVAFWKSVATRYKDNGRILYELYNEPRDISWEVWQNGGDSGDGFQVVGMQELYDTVRATGADNLVIIGGLRWAYDLSGVPTHRIAGYNIVYASHVYDYGDKQPSMWEADWGFLTASDPVFVTEFGSSANCSGNYSQQLIDYVETRKVSWAAWAWYPGGCDFPALIDNWAGTPTAAGQVVKAALSK